jgi:predicted DNA-binding ribbon-helix-helix protein
VNPSNGPSPAKQSCDQPIGYIILLSGVTSMARYLTDSETRLLNLTDGSRREVTVERAVWVALDRIAEREGLTWTALASELFRRGSNTEIRSALRVMTLQYFRYLSFNPNDINCLHYSLISTQ